MEERKLDCMYHSMSSRDRSRIPLATFEKKQRTLVIVRRLEGYNILRSTVISSDDVIVKVRLFLLMSPDTRYFSSKGWYRKAGNRSYHVILEYDGVWRISFTRTGATAC